MHMPGFNAEGSLYRVRVRYSSASVLAEITSGIVPALPSCASCERACDKCWDCTASGREWCPTCGVCNYCWGRSCPGGGSGGGGTTCCEFLVNPSPGENCHWCGPEPW